MLNPYSHQNLFGFIKTLFMRGFQWLLQPGSTSLVSDELQLLTLSCIALSAAIVGTFLIHRKMTMLANALSHTVLFGIVVTFLILKKSFQLIDPTLNFKVMFVASLVTGLVTALLSQIVATLSRLQKDAAIGLVFTTFFALGILLITLFSKNSHIGTELIMGNVDALHPRDLLSVFLMFGCNLGILLIFMRGLKVSTFDPIFSRMQGFSPSFYNLLILFQLSLTAIGAFRAVGVVLVLAFFIIPPLCARMYANSLEKQILIACLIGVFSSLMGVAVSRHMLSVYNTPLSTGGLTVLSLYTFYFLSWFGRLAFKAFQQRSIQATLAKKRVLKPE